MAFKSAAAVEDWENYKREVVSIHTQIAGEIDWKAIVTRSPPSEPPVRISRRSLAEQELSRFRPSILNLFKGGSAKMKARLEAALADAILQDQAEYLLSREEYADAVAEWEADIELATRLLRGEAAAIRNVVEEMQSLDDVSLLGTSIKFLIRDNYLHALVVVHGDEIIPSTRRKMLASGRLSETKMPTGQFNELYQDYVCSAALKVAGDLFAILPLGEIYITCCAVMLNPESGHQEPTPILSAQFVRETLRKLNLAKIDPSDAMRNFNTRMSFSKTKGFSRIQPMIGDVPQ